MAKITYLGPLPSRCGFSVKDTTNTLRKMTATYLLKKLNSGNKRISNYVLYCGNRWNHDF